MPSPRTPPSRGLITTLPPSLPTRLMVIGCLWSMCNNNHLKACIIAASESVWGIPDMFPAQLDDIFCLLHPMHPNHLAAIQQTGAGKTHILWTLGAIEQGIILIFIPLLTLSADVMAKSCAPTSALTPS
jgi:hypothetical protein